jgi:membrane protein required for colicin V production
MNTVDLVVLVVLGLNALLGAARGFARQSLRLAGALLGVGAACGFYDRAGELLRSWFDLSGWGETSIKALGFAAVGVAVFLAGQLAAHLASTALEKARLGGADRFLGLVYGVAKGGVLCVLVFAAADVFVAHLPPAASNAFYGGPNGDPPPSRAYGFFLDHVKADTDALRAKLAAKTRQPSGK